MKMARHFVNSESVPRATIETYEKMKRIVENSDDYTGKQVKEAREFLEKNTGELELPF